MVICPEQHTSTKLCPLETEFILGLYAKRDVPFQTRAIFHDGRPCGLSHDLSDRVGPGGLLHTVGSYANQTNRQCPQRQAGQHTGVQHDGSRIIDSKLI